MKEENEPTTPDGEDTAFDKLATRDLPQPDATKNAAENVRGGTQLPPDKKRQTAQGL